MIKYVFVIGFKPKMIYDIIWHTLITGKVYIFTEASFILFEWLFGLFNIYFIKEATVELVESNGENGSTFIGGIRYLGPTDHDIGRWHQRQVVSKHDTVMIGHYNKLSYGVNVCIR